jgi:hypothetical protein
MPSLAVVGLDIVAVRETVAEAGGLTGTGKFACTASPAVSRGTRGSTRAKPGASRPWCQLVERPPLGPCADLWALTRLDGWQCLEECPQLPSSRSSPPDWQIPVQAPSSRALWRAAANPSRWPPPCSCRARNGAFSMSRSSPCILDGLLGRRGRSRCGCRTVRHQRWPARCPRRTPGSTRSGRRHHARPGLSAAVGRDNSSTSWPSTVPIPHLTVVPGRPWRWLLPRAR